ncbi:MAG: hypothetical protein KDA61_12690, partial [Planctomycetales bacterium]|nr:hypothetical protein [Planctomycetales bacterium]
LADEADLSLVLDSPPPGSFNYTDTRAYTPDEAIDLVNGVLASKGYTLLRRERMLMLVNLQDEIPRTLVPRVELADIDRRGAYEFVTVSIPLEGRNAEATLAEIKPLLSRFGEASALAASGTLQVTDRAGVMRVVNGVVQAIPKPQPADKPSPKKPGEKPEFRVYDLGGADAAAAVQMLEAVVEGKFVHDPSGDRVNVHAVPSQHAIVEQLMDQVRVSADKRRFQIEIYPLEGVAPERQTRLVAELSLAAGDGQVRLDSEREQLVVWATASRQMEVRRALMTLLMAEGGDGKTARVYDLRYRDAAALAPTLATVTPRAQVSVGASNDQILAVATRRDHETLLQLIEQLDRAPRAENVSLKEYSLSEPPPAELPDLLAKAAPQAKIRIDAAQRTVVVVGDDEQQRLVAELMGALERDLGRRPERPLKIYPLDARQQERLTNVRPALEEAAPRARIVWSPGEPEAYVWATPEQHEMIAGILQKLAETPEPTPTRSLRAYPTHANQLDAMAALAARIVPDAVCSIDRSGRRLLVWADEDDHRQLEPLLKKSAASSPVDADALQYRAYRAGEIDLTLAVQMLTERFPDGVFQADMTARSIVAQATPADHQRIDALLRELRDGSMSRTEREVVVYELKGIAAPQAEGLRQLFPQMRLTVDASTQQLAAWGTSDDQQQLRDALQTLFPPGSGATFSYDLTTRSLLAVADAQQLELVETVVQAADGENAGPEETRELRVHSLAGVDATSATASLQKIFQERAVNPLLTIEPTGRRLLAVAAPAEQELIEQTLEALRPGPTQVDVFVLETMEPYAAQRAVESLFDGRYVGQSNPVDVQADADGGRLVVRATAEQLEEIRTLLVKMGEIGLLSADAGDGKTFVPLPVDEAPAVLEQFEAAWTRISDHPLEVTPAATGERPADSGRRSQSSSPTDHGEEQTETPPTDSVPSDAPTTQSPDASGKLAPVVMTRLPRGVAIESTDRRALQTALGLLRSLDPRLQGGGGDFSVYPLQNADAERVTSVLTNVFRQYGAGRRLTIAADERINAVVVRGSRTDRREVEALLKTLDTSQETDYFKPNQPVVLNLKFADADQVHQQLRSLYRTELSRGARQPPIEIPPGADSELVATLQQINASREGPLLSMEVDRDTNSLLLVAPRPLLQEISQFVERLDQQSTQTRQGVRVLALEELQGDETLRSLQRILTERRR